MLFEQALFVPNQRIRNAVTEAKKIDLWMKREDLLHPLVSGNKFRKLKYNIKEALRQRKTAVVTYGGAYSNHILATAVAAKLYGLSSYAIIRGEELASTIETTLQENATLRWAYDHGMRFRFVSREWYRQKDTPEAIQEIQDWFGEAYRIPEGGTNLLAVEGCKEIISDTDSQFDYITCCLGTGGTALGVIQSARAYQTTLGFSVLKGYDWEEFFDQYKYYSKYQTVNSYHFGGYGKINQELIEFINTFGKETGIPLDPVYTGKMMYGLFEMIKQDQFPPKSRILAIHTGGLQGISGMNQKLRKKNLPQIETHS